MAFSKQEIEKVLNSVTSVSGRALKYIEKKKIITDMPNNGKGEFVVMKKIGDKRFKISFFSGGKEIKKDAKGKTVGGSFPTVKGMTSHGIKIKGLNPIEQVKEVVVVPTVTEISENVPVVDVRQTPEREEGSEMVSESRMESPVLTAYSETLDRAFGQVGN